MNFDLALTYGNLIAHFVPGTITLSALLLRFDKVGTLLFTIIKSFSGSDIVSVFVFLFTALGIGLVIDGMRFSLMDPLICRVWHVSRPEGLFQNVTGENLSAFQYVIELYWRYYQFYSNWSMYC